MTTNTPVAEKTKRTRTTKPYKVTVHMNGDVIKKTSDDLTKTFLSIKPEQIYTEVYISVQKDNHVMDRRLSLIDAKRFFNIDYVMEVFISNLMLV